MKFALTMIVIGAWCASSFAQSCSGRSFSQNVRERHVTRSFSVARGTGCSGVALVPQTVYVPQTRYVVADLPKPVVAPQPMPKGPAPVVAVVQTCEPPLAGSRVRAKVGNAFHGLAGILCR